MRIMSEDEKERRRPERDKKIILNIPVEGKSEISKDEIYRGNNLLGSINNSFSDLETKLKELHLYKEDYDESSSSEDDEENKQKLLSQYTAKSPDRPNDKKKENKNSRKPYFLSTRVGALQTGGDMITSLPDFMTKTNYNQIPQPVAEYVSPTTTDIPVAEYDVNDFYNYQLTDNERKNLDVLVDVAQYQSDGESSRINTPVNQKLRSKDSDSCNSPDSSYGTMSPGSAPPPSPYMSSLHSPNPQMDKIRLTSESDSMSSDFEHSLGASESSFGPIEIIPQIKLQPPRSNCIYIPPPPRKIICAPQPMVQIVPVASQVQTSSRPPIQPDSEIIVQEFELDKPAVYRLKKKRLLNDYNITIQWTKAIEEAKPLQNLINRGKIKNIGSENEEKRLKDELRKNLIDLILAGPNQRFFYERLFSRIRLYNRSHGDIMTGKDINGRTPLFAAAVLRNDCPIIARLIVDEIEVDRSHPTDFETGKLDDEENTILHYLARQGDSHAQVLSELLNSKRFDVNHKNIGSKTALHKAVECHKMPTKSCLACVKLFVKHGASLQMQDFDGKTALHLAVSISGDPLLLKALLQFGTGRNAINVEDNDRNTPLHLAARRNDLSLATQKALIERLVDSKARHDLRNNQEKTALMLVAQDRKEDIKNIFRKI